MPTAAAHTVSRAHAQAQRANLAWLLRLRWGAIAGQAVTIAGVDLMMGIALPLWLLCAIIAVELASNAALSRWARERVTVPERVLVAVMVADVLVLTLLLHLTGGPSNPFNFLYLVHIALAAVVLPARWTWTLAALSFACFGALFLERDALEHAHHGASHADMRMHLYGMWIAFGVAAAFIAYFITRVSLDLARREQELQAARALAARSERLASLATLAAGAAHELSSPLSTIAVAAKELERDLVQGATGQEKISDARLIREEVARCREILARMAADSGADAAPGTADVSVEQLLEAALGAVAGRARIAVSVDDAARGCRLQLSPHALAQALRCVLENAQHAVAGGGEVSVQVALERDACRVEVRDSGAGMTPEVLARAGEPFFTTREPGRGMGLGLFVSRAALERMGGKLELRSAPGRGTTATLLIPLPPACDKSPHGAAAVDRGTLEAG